MYVIHCNKKSMFSLAKLSFIEHGVAKMLKQIGVKQQNTPSDKYPCAYSIKKGQITNSFSSTLVSSISSYSSSRRLLLHS